MEVDREVYTPRGVVRLGSLIGCLKSVCPVAAAQ